MNSCAVSVIVPVCNVQKFLRECLDSIIDQTLQEIQVICIDDGSTDNSLRILEEYAAKDPRVEIITKPNSGYGNSMNRGLAAAKGEYVGIVESDDFADLHMFETLYSVCKEHNLDVVKSNFVTHITIPDPDPDPDPFVESLKGCTYNKVFCPVDDDQKVFAPSPAIWSALYRRDFLEEKGIKFLETPGASFQDTSFNFKVFALAERAMLLKEAFLHYRIDNAGSSVKSLSKVFCVCDEYKEIWNFLRSDETLFEKLKYRVPQVQYNGYLWNLERLTPRLRYEFYLTFVEDFAKFQKEELLSKEAFEESVWNSLSEMLFDFDGYYKKTYGPIQPETSFVLLLDKSLQKDYKKVILNAYQLLSDNDEMFVLCENSTHLTKEEFKNHNIKLSGCYVSEGHVSSTVLNQIDLEEITGKRIVAIQASGNVKTVLVDLKEIALDFKGASSGWVSSKSSVVAGMWDRSQIKKDVPLTIPLLFGGCYSRSLKNQDILPSFVFDISYEAEPPTVKTFEEALSTFALLYEEFSSEFILNGKVINKNMYVLFCQLWKRVVSAYDEMDYNERLKYGERPSPECFRSRIPDSFRFADRPEVSVIIPVYNVEKYIRECLDSVLSQDVFMEVICVNDGGSDSSLEILEEYAANDQRILVVSQLNGGAGSARNWGIELAQGEYLAFIDPDDFYPNAKVLSGLLGAAKANNEKLSCGSFEAFYPDGKVNKFIGGSQSFYSVKKEGSFDLTDLGTDYGWIRFLYHRSIFDEGNIRFPEYRWYEDPVFFVEVMNYCETCYGITDVVYCYRENYKSVSWDKVRVRDLLKGVSRNMEYADSNNLRVLYSNLVSRLNRDYYIPLIENKDDEEIFSALLSIQCSLNLSLIDEAIDQNLKEYTLRPLKKYVYLQRDVAVVRAAKSLGDSRIYKKLQDFKRNH